MSYHHGRVLLPMDPIADLVVTRTDAGYGGDLQFTLAKSVGTDPK
jgi:hypothetical protein